MKLLADKNFLSLFMGRLITNAGDSIYYITTTCLAAELTNDSFYVGLISAVILILKGLQFLGGPLSIKPMLILIQIVQVVLILMIPIFD